MLLCVKVPISLSGQISARALKWHLQFVVSRSGP